MNEMLKLAPSPSLTKDTAQVILSELGHVEQIRYIVLTVCVKKGPTLPPIPLTNKTPILSYALSIDSIIAYNNQLASTQITLPSDNPISELGRLILDKLILSKPNTPDGISIVADSPMNNPPQLNIKGRQVLRQFYGENLGSTSDRRILRPAYGFKKGRQAEGTDLRRIYVKPFCAKMSRMSHYIMNLIKANHDLLGISSLDLSNDFNSCSVLLYHNMNGIKDISTMGFHTDLKYSKKGVYSIKNNCQSINTPTVIVTIGKSRYLKWRQVFINSVNKIEVDNDSVFQMLLSEGAILILHPHDERPHYDEKTNRFIKFQHGGVKTPKDGCSIAFVFRVVSKTEQFDEFTHCHVTDGLPRDNMKDYSDIDEMYNNIDIEEFHSSLINEYREYLT